MSEKIKVKLDEDCSLSLLVTDDSGWSCRLERWHSEYVVEWFTGITVWDDEGKERMHAGMGTCEISKEAALERIKYAKRMLDWIKEPNDEREA